MIIPGIHPIGTMPAIARIAVGTPIRPDPVIVAIVPGIGIPEHHLHVHLIVILFFILETNTLILGCRRLPIRFC